MAKAKEVTTKFRVDLTEFKQGISQANQDIKLANAQFKAASAGMDDWSKSSDGLSAKINQLNSVLEAEKTKLSTLIKQHQATKKAEEDASKKKQELKKRIEALQKEYDELVKTQGDSSDSAKKLAEEIEDLNKEYLDAEKAQKRNGKAVDDLEIKMLNQQAAINKTEKELGEYKKSLTELSSSNNKVKTAFEKLEDTISDQEKKLEELKKQYQNVVLEQGENSDEAKQLAKEMSSLNEELSDTKKEMSEVKKKSDDLSDALDDVGESANNSEGGFTILKGALGDLASNVIQGVASKIGDLVSSLFELSEATEEYRTMQGKLEGSAKQSGYSVDFASKKYKEFYKYLGDDQMATNAVTNLMGLGTSTENVTDLANGAIGAWSKYGDSIPIESLTEAINETVQVGKVTGSFADTINWVNLSNKEMANMLGKGSKAQKAFNKAIKDGETQEDAFSAALSATTDEQERAEIVANFLNSTYGESKSTYDEMTSSIQEANEAELALKETQAQIGETLAPVNTAFTELKNKALEALIPVVEKIAQTFLDLKTYLEEHPELLKVITPIVLGLATAFGILAGALAIQGLINGVTKAIAFLNTTLLANPIVLIVAAIAGLVAAFIYLWNNVDGFRQFFLDAWEAIKKATLKAKEWIGNALSSIGEFFSNLWDKIKQFGKSIKELPVKLGALLADAIKKVIEWRNNMLAKAKEVAKNFVTNVINFIKELPGKIWAWLVNVVKKIMEWRSNMLARAKEIGTNFVTSIINFFKQIPSKIWSAIVGAVSRVAEWGSNLISTGKEKISSFVSNIFNKAKELPGKIYSAIRGAISRVAQWGSEMISTAKSKISSFVSNIVSWIKQLPSKISSVGKNMVEGIWNGISGATTWLKNKITDWVGKPLKWAKDILGINSPSKVFADVIGRGMAEGIDLGFGEEMKNVKKDMSKALDFTKNGLSVPSLGLNGASYGAGNVSNSEVVNNYNFYQTNNSPEALSSTEIYRQTHNLINLVKGGA